MNGPLSNSVGKLALFLTVRERFILEKHVGYAGGSLLLRISGRKTGSVLEFAWRIFYARATRFDVVAREFHSYPFNPDE